jgi:hypothetical protein
MNPFVFVVGCPRSGTTLLQRLMDAHPELAVVHETLWIPSFYERRLGLTPDGDVTPALLPRLLAHRRFEQLGIAADELDRLFAATAPVRYASFVGALFDRYGAQRGKPLVGDKSPGYVRSIPVLHGLWPHARFVHLIRDGRDVCLSALGWAKADRVFADFGTWPDEPVMTAALWWERSVRLGREAGRALPAGLYQELRYERLVEDPETECRALCGFLGLRYEPAMLAYHEGRMRAAPSLSSKRQWLPPTPGLRDWRTEMDRRDLDRFEAVAGTFLDELGYERATSNGKAALVEPVRATRRRFADGVAARGRPLPECWR